MVLNKLPGIAALDPHVGAAIRRLPIDCPPVRHDSELAAIEEVHHVLVRHVGVFGVFKISHILRFVQDLTKGSDARVVGGYDSVDTLAVVGYAKNIQPPISWFAVLANLMWKL